MINIKGFSVIKSFFGIIALVQHFRFSLFFGLSLSLSSSLVVHLVFCLVKYIFIITIAMLNLLPCCSLYIVRDWNGFNLFKVEREFSCFKQKHINNNIFQIQQREKHIYCTHEFERIPFILPSFSKENHTESWGGSWKKYISFLLPILLLLFPLCAVICFVWSLPIDTQLCSIK